MRWNQKAIGAACGLALGSACATEPPPAAVAASVDRMQCDGSATSIAATELLRSNAVVGVVPIYSHIIVTPNNAEERVCGSKLLIRPPPGMTTWEMTRILQCHSARVLLGKVPGTDVSDDPYWLADRWLHIDVQPENGNFAVTISADTVHDNLEIFGRAAKYGSGHMLVSSAVP
jgi:hypothetical protein